jgi:hypothetical protein
MPSVGMAIAMRGLRSVMEKTLATRHVIHTFQGECTTTEINQTFKDMQEHVVLYCCCNAEPCIVFLCVCRSYGRLRCRLHCVIDSTNCKYFT